MTKPDWKDAPEWARYLAKDKNGTWFWYASKPDKMESGYWNNTRGDRCTEVATPDWGDSLEKKSEAQHDPLRQALDLLSNVTAALDNTMLHAWKSMGEADLYSRRRLVKEAEAFLAEHGPVPETEEEET